MLAAIAVRNYILLCIGSTAFNTSFILNISDAFESSKMLCDQYYLTSPELKLKQVNGKMRASMSLFLL